MATRNTIQRAIIEDELRQLANHPTADEVFEAVHAEHPSISRATVFRTLNRLSDEGKVLRVRINNGADRFDHQTFDHYHVRCVSCGRVDDVMIPQVRGVNEAAAEATGYEICGHTLQFDGICPACRQAASGEVA
ncbi:Fur family transcriptional regulator [Olsenella profusa]|uniref:Transcriptional repressor n=1 Tax=Olsenella profusa TaxID=138595 RepID=A0ABS2F2E8_9ACTN|nr:transcriptional repressor [Olsenella profusa]MBM6774743.1 transcriptional repressor [Olsenella profusa]